MTSTGATARADRLQKLIGQLLREIQQTLRPVVQCTPRWSFLDESRSEHKPIPDPELTLRVALAEAGERIRSLAVHAEAVAAFAEDEVFVRSQALAGHFGTFDTIMDHLLQASTRLLRGRLVFDSEQAIVELLRLRTSLQTGRLAYRCSGRIAGIALRCKRFTLPDGIELERLSFRQRNDREPMSEFISTMDAQSLGWCATEARFQVPVQVNLDQESGILQAQNEVRGAASRVLETLQDALLLALPGPVRLAGFGVDGGFTSESCIQWGLPGWLPWKSISIGRRELRTLARAYTIVKTVGPDDPHLRRALSRFLLGRKRDDMADKLVDYVIAWESLLTTQNGSSATQELSYRFSINGASLLKLSCGLDPLDTQRRMKEAYALRSKVVHGEIGGISSEPKGSKANAIATTYEFLERTFGKTVFWLWERPGQSRPYKAQQGWEKLLW